MSGPRASSLQYGRSLWLRVALLSLLDSIALFAFLVILEREAWGLMASLVVGTLFINWAYLSPRSLALRWLAPGLILMAAFVVFPLIFTVYVAFTNWSTGNILSKSQSISSWESERYIDPADSALIHSPTACKVPRQRACPRDQSHISRRPDSQRRAPRARVGMRSSTLSWRSRKP